MGSRHRCHAFLPLIKVRIKLMIVSKPYILYVLIYSTGVCKGFVIQAHTARVWDECYDSECAMLIPKGPGDWDCE